MTIKNVVAGLQKEKQEAIASRFPCRAIMVKNVAQYCKLLSELKKISDIRIVKSSELFSNMDVMPKYEKLKAAKYQNEWLILTGVSEYLRLFSKKEAIDRRFASLWSYQAPASSTGRIIIPLWGCEAQWFDSALNLSGDVRQQDFYFDCSDPNENEQNLNLLVLSGVFDQYITKLDAIKGDLKIGLQDWFEYWEDPASDGEEFVLLTKRCNSVQTTNGSVSIHVVKDTLAFIKEHMKGSEVLTTANCHPDMQNELLDYALKGKSLDEALLSILNVATFNGIDIMGKWKNMSLSHKKIVALWLSIHPDNSYTSHCFSQSSNVTDIPDKIMHEIFGVRLNRPEWIDEYRKLVSGMAILPDEKFFNELDNIPAYERRLDFMTGVSRKERIYLIRMVGKWMRSDSVQVYSSGKLKEIYPELYEYLNHGIHKTDEEYTAYMSRYKSHKLENTVPFDDDLYFNGFDVDSYENRYSVLSDHIDGETAILWVDAMGAEWLPLLTWSVSQNCDATIKKTAIVHSNLPTETCYNALWNDMDIPYEKLDKLDKLAHKGVIDEPDYYACVEEQLAFVTGIHTKITEMLKRYRRVIVTGDHGTSRLAARCFHTKEGMISPQDATVCSHGRYCKLPSNTTYFMPNVKCVKKADGTQFAVYSNYDHFKQSGFAAGADDDNPVYGEVHGGATPEEVLVPIVVIDTNQEIPLTAQWDKSTVKIMMKKAKLVLEFNKPVQQLQVKVAGIDALVSSADGGLSWSVVFAGLKQGTYTPHIQANNKIVLTSDITIKSAIGGDGDLP
ncbi:MAG: BREX-4 system phosphatase PglZ [Oscillospiraceae bacterium]|nr:BREX-4 system phosphatase PglZ [Oscillospiraceae bacterium]